MILREEYWYAAGGAGSRRILEEGGHRSFAGDHAGDSLHPCSVEEDDEPSADAELVAMDSWAARRQCKCS